MTWLCSCGITNVNVNLKCARDSCKTERPKEFEPYDSFDALLSACRMHEINRATGFHSQYYFYPGGKVTPQEELFKELFNHEKVLVRDMDLLTLRAHREELCKIAFEARARITATDEVEKELKTKHNAGKPSGFQRSVNTDENATNAINTIKERQKKMSKMDRIQAGLEKLGISTTDASKLMSAGTILGRIKAKASEELDEVSLQKEEPKIQVFNPFEKKKEE